MKRALLHGIKDLRLEEVPEPRPGRGEILVHVEAALTCGTDLKTWRRGGHPKFPDPPFPFGHEFSGRVKALGAGVRGWKEGDRITAANSAPCGECGSCRAGRASLCSDLLFLNGTFASSLILPERIVKKNALRASEGLDSARAALIEPLACALKGADDAALGAGDRVLVLGSGPLGLMLAILAKKSGCRTVVLGRGPARLAAAKSAGLETVELDQAGAAEACERALGGPPDKIIEAVGSPEAWSQALDWIPPGGLVLFFGGCAPGTKIPLDAAKTHYGELTIRGSFHHCPAYVREALELLEANSQEYAFLLSGEAPLADLDAVFHKLDRREIPFKMVIRP